MEQVETWNDECALCCPELSGTLGEGHSERSRNAFRASAFGTFRNSRRRESPSHGRQGADAAQKPIFVCVILMGSNRVWIKTRHNRKNLPGFALKIAHLRGKIAKIFSPPAAATVIQRRGGSGRAVRNVPGTRSELPCSERSCYLGSSGGRFSAFRTPVL